MMTNLWLRIPTQKLCTTAAIAVAHHGAIRTHLKGVGHACGNEHPVASSQFLPVVDDRATDNKANAFPFIVRMRSDFGSWFCYGSKQMRGLAQVDRQLPLLKSTRNVAGLERFPQLEHLWVA